MNSPVADLLNAWKRLGADDSETRARIASLLGFVERPAGRSAGEPVERPRPAERALKSPTLGVPPPPEATEARRLLRIHELSDRAEARLGDVLGSETMESASGLPSLPAKPPLLHPLWQRGIFSALLSVPFETREPDTTALLDDLSQGRRVVRIPWRTAPSLSLGVRCFLDVGPAMHPFLEDQLQLIGSLQLTFGQDRVAIGYFEVLPDSAGVRFEDETENAASPYAPILLVTDFGAIAVPGRRWALPDDWVDYIRRERQKGAAGVFALSPLGRRALPRAVRAEIAALEWDRSASVRSVVRERARLGAV